MQSPFPRLIAVMLAIIVFAPVVGSPAAARDGDGLVEIVAVSNRADLVAGGDVLLEIRLPDGRDPSDLRVEVGDRDVSEAFAVRAGGRILGLVRDLPVGGSTVTAILPDGRGADLEVTNHPIGGPVIAGPQVQPWICTTEENGLGPPLDEQCNAATVVTWEYYSSATETFQPYDPESPPSDVAETTTDEGVTVPFIVRVETGAMDRGIYQVAVLAEPDQEFAPWSRPPGWNGKVVWPFGGGTDAKHVQSTPIDGVAREALGRGFMVASNGLNTQGNNSNSVVSAEAVMMLQEHIVETFGEIRYTIGVGCSGGGIQQQIIAGMYPGLLDGLIPICSFPDIWTTAMEVGDCDLLNTYWNETSPHLWAVAQQRAFAVGHESPASCVSWVGLFANRFDAGRAAGCGLPEEEVYDPGTNPEGVRCGTQDYQRAVWGPRTPDRWGPVEQSIGRGFADRPFDNIGLQYGLQALEAGQITAEQFVDMNAKVGGLDIDGNAALQRSEASPEALRTAYVTGQVTDFSHLATVPILDLRGHDNSEIHTSIYSYNARARLDAANGHHDNHVIWTSPVALVGDPTFSNCAIENANAYPCPEQTPLTVMDAWLAAIETDDSDRPLAEKVVADKPEAAVDSCFPAPEQRVPGDSTCGGTLVPAQTTRMAAGQPLTNDVLKCQLTPLDRDAYAVEFTDDQWGRLQEAFPTGVCDNTKPGVEQQGSRPWTTFAGGPGGQLLGPAPTSTPFGQDAPREVLRHGGATRIETAVALSQLRTGGADIVVLARADSFADALTGAPLAVALDAPLLLTDRDQLSTATAVEIARLGATDVVLLGGEAAVGADVAAALAARGLRVDRVAGANRYATATAIAGRLTAAGGAADEVLLASGEQFPDALSASALGAIGGVPVLLTGRSDLPAETADAIGADTAVTIVGGEAVVSEAVAVDVDAAAGSVRRIAGPTRYATSALVADEAMGQAAVPGSAWIASGTDFPDALVASAAAGREGGVLLLADGADLEASPETRDWLAAHSGEVGQIDVAGGPAAVAAAVLEALARL